MARKSFMDLVWPLGGIDRAFGYQSQPPYTTPDAFNVRPEDSSERRNRGGPRPGLVKAFRTELPGPIRLLTKVGVLKYLWERTGSYFIGRTFYDATFAIPGSTYNKTDFNGAPAFSGDEYGFGIGDVPSTLNTYERVFHIRPANIDVGSTGTIDIHVGLSDATQDLTQNTIKITFTFAGGDCDIALDEIVGGSSVGTDSAATIEDGAFAGKITIAITGNQIKVNYRNADRITYTATGVPGSQLAFVVNSVDSSIITTSFSQDYQEAASAVQNPNPNPRRDLVVAVSNGEVWLEDTVDTMRKVIGAGTLRDDVELTAVDREQKLFIADYGTIETYDGGASSSPDFNIIQAPSAVSASTDFAVLVTNSDYSQNERQTITLEADGGQFSLSFKGDQTVNLAWNASAAEVRAALSNLPSINTIVNVDVTDDWVVEFTGDLGGEDQPLIKVNVNDLTNSGGDVSAEVVTTQVAAKAEKLNGTYQITNVSGTDITIDPPLPAIEGTDVGSIEFNLVRVPKIFDPKEETLVPHEATKGQVPAGCRLVALYRDCIVYAAPESHPQAWYMSRQGDPFDFDYTAEDVGGAVFAGNADAGQLGDPITALIPHGDQCLVFGCYNSLWILRGHPRFGGDLDPLSRKVGIIGPNAWCRTPDDMVVFLSADGLYVMPAGCGGLPTPLSRDRVPSDLLAVTPEHTAASLSFDLVGRGIHIMLTSREGQADHWWFDWELKTYWRVGFDRNFDPFTQHERAVWDGPEMALMGCRDGYIRHFDPTAEMDDDDTRIDSHVYIGPFALARGQFSEGILAEIQATLGESSGAVDWSIHAGDSGESAYRSGSRESGTWTSPGLNPTAHPRVRGVSALMKIANKSGSKARWYFEKVKASITSAGKTRVR